MYSQMLPVGTSQTIPQCLGRITPMNCANVIARCQLQPAQPVQPGTGLITAPLHAATSSIQTHSRWQQGARTVVAHAKGRGKGAADADAGAGKSKQGNSSNSWDTSLAGISNDLLGEDDLEEGDEDEDAAALLQMDEFDEDEDEYEYEDGDEDELLDDDGDNLDGEADEFERDVTDTTVSDAQDQQLPFAVETVTFQDAMAEVNRRKVDTVPEIRILSPEEVARIEAEANKTTAIVMPEGAQLALNRTGYQAFLMEGVELLIGETADGQLDLNDAFVFDEELSVYAPPQIRGRLPKGPVRLQVIPWIMRKTADILKHKEGLDVMKKVYFIGVQSLMPYRLNLQQVYCFDAKTRVLSREDVKVAKNVKDPVLRIREDGIYIQDTSRAPPPHDVSAQSEEKINLEEMEQELQERIEEMESQAEALDELEEAPDISAADMM